MMGTSIVRIILQVLTPYVISIINTNYTDATMRRWLIVKDGCVVKNMATLSPVFTSTKDLLKLSLKYIAANLLIHIGIIHSCILTRITLLSRAVTKQDGLVSPNQRSNVKTTSMSGGSSSKMSMYSIIPLYLCLNVVILKDIRECIDIVITIRAFTIRNVPRVVIS